VSISGGESSLGAVHPRCRFDIENESWVLSSSGRRGRGRRRRDRGRWPLSPGPSVASPAWLRALYPVNPNGTSVDDDRCLTPAQDYVRVSPTGRRLPERRTALPQLHRSAEAHVAAVRELLPSDCSVYVRIVPVSSAVGRALQDRIGIDRGPRGAGVEVNSIASIPSPTSQVGVTKLTPQVQAELERDTRRN